MLKTKLGFLICSFFAVLAHAQQIERPKLVVGIVIDQMRYDYLYRYWDKYSEGGFKRLVLDGYNCNNTNYSYVPTYTAPGHASIYTGTTPSRHGIISNDWYSRAKGDMIYCTEDKSVKTVRGQLPAPTKNNPKQMMPAIFKERAGQMSPANMLVSTIGDELILFNKSSKVVGISLKDRGAILPAGHLGKAYWFEGESGYWISSTYYGETLPKWLQAFNDKKLPEKYLSQTWNTLLPIAQYTESLPDDSPYEGLLKGKSKPTFPYDLKVLNEAGGLGIIRSTPFGNTLTKDLAIAALYGENLGKNGFTDMLNISFSSPDYIGHTFGPDAIETQDTYLRLDRELAELFDVFDQWIGLNNCLIFLTADHGGSRVPSYLLDLKIPSGYINFENIGNNLKLALNEKYQSDSLILHIEHDQVYLDHQLIAAKGLDFDAILNFCSAYLLQQNGVQDVYKANIMREQQFLSDDSRAKLQKGFMTKRSGDLLILLEPAWMDYPQVGTTHGSNHSYDTHVPLLFFGWKVKKGETSEKIYIEDIATSLAQWLRISFPNASSGKVIQGLLE